MRRTRKWAYVRQEATRLAGLGLTPTQIAKKLDLNRSTVKRWMASGKLNDTRREDVRRPRGSVTTTTHSPAEWANAVRDAYALDATDEQLVIVGEAALTVARNRKADPRLRLAAAGRFQAVVKQLALVARKSEEEQPQPDVPVPTKPAAVARVRRFDPRTQLMAVK
jgi:hypothetical protein